MGAGNNQKNKPHKTKFSSKSQRAKHKIAKEAVGGPTRGGGRGLAANAKAQRLLRNKQVREQKRAEHLANKRACRGASAPPRILVLLGLSSHVDLGDLRTKLIAACGPSDGESLSTTGVEADDVAMDDVDGGDAEKGSERGAIVGVKSVSGAVSVGVSRHKLRLTIMEVQVGDLLQCLEAIKIADIIAFVVPASPPLGAAEASHVDAWGRKVLSLARAQGLPSMMGIIQGLTAVPLKRRADAKKLAAAALAKEFPEECKSFAVDSADDCQQLLRHLAENRLVPPVWRTQRPYVLAHQVDFVPNPATPGVGTLQVAGYLRGRGISVNQLVHVAGQGDFQLSQIDGPDDPVPLQKRQRKAADVSMGDAEGAPAVVLAVANPALQEPLVVENTPDPLAGEQTWPTEEELEAAGKKRKVKRVPKGTSSYQAAWYIGDSDEEGGERSEGEEEEGGEGDGGGDEAMAVGEVERGIGLELEGKKKEKGKRGGGGGGGEEAADGEGGEEEEEEEEGDDDSEWEEVETEGKSREGRTSRATSVWGEDHGDLMEEDDRMTPAQREADLQNLKALHQEDQEFPDEIDTPLDVAARERFAKYRGLKSFRTSPWDPKESLPAEYSRIFAFENFKRTRKHVLARAAQADGGASEGTVAVGSFVRLHIAGVPQSAAEGAAAEARRRVALVVCGLLSHETKMSVLHFGVRKAESYGQPIRSKERLLFHCGFRRFGTRPIFSTDDLNLDKHKFERFLHPGRFCIASAFAPVAFPPLPLLVFKETDDGDDHDDDVQLAATGSLREANPDRVILKKIVLSGFPLSVSKRKAVVKYMFHNPNDVRWFKPVDLYTKYGRRGRISAPVGEKGNMKCIFDGVVQQRDAVCMSLYKRVYPKWPEPAA